MKRKLIIGSLLTATLLFTGCGDGGSTYYPPTDPNLTTLFLIDQNGNSYGGIPYKCDSMYDWEYTKVNGEFTFSPPDDCVFDFTGLEGNYGDPLIDDIVYIVDDLDRGKGGIEYECANFGASTTYGDGSFDYDIDDQCTFYL